MQSADQIAQATLQQMYWQTLALALQTLLAILAIGLAFQWKKEAVGNKKIELALRLGRAAIEMREVCINIAKAKPDVMYQHHLKSIAEKWQVLNELKWEVEILFDDGKIILNKIDKYFELSNQLEDAIKSTYDKGLDKFVIIDDKPYIEKFTAITDDLIKSIRQYSH